MDKPLYRNFIIFTFLALTCFAALSFMLIESNKEIERSSGWVSHSNKVIVSTEKVVTILEQLLSSQRGYLLTGQQAFVEKYQDGKGLLARHLSVMRDMTVDNPEQARRVANISQEFDVFTQKLETRANNFRGAPELGALTNFSELDNLRTSITRLHDDMIAEEYDLLQKRVAYVESKKDQYFLILLVGGTVCVTLLMLFNGILLHTQSRRNNTERILKETEARFALAAEGANDGIFDWNIQNGSIFYSRPFFTMLGYDRPSHTGKMSEIRDLIHPEDVDKAFNYVDRYLRGELSEYSNTYRARHSTGRWIWINSRAKAMYDQSGKAIRMVGAHTDITYMKEYQDRLKVEKEAAEKANRAKTEFLAHMSHEIRTPLTAISGIAEILERQKEHLSEKVQRLAATLSSSTATLKDLINDILDFAKIESGEMTLESRDYDPATLFDQVTNIMSIQAREKNLQFTFDYDSVDGKVLIGDPLRIRQILINLIGNAIKFTDSGNVTVTVKLNKAEDEMDIQVKDTGIGVPPENFEQIFLQFRQGDASVSRRVGGTGLGLAISRNLARLMGGDITIESATGKGTKFTVKLPTDVAADDAEAVKMTVPKVETKKAPKNKILIAEDYEGNIVVLGYLLEEMGIAYDVVHTGKQAVESWQKKPYDLILMDVQMPEMDGLTATKTIRDMEKAKGIAPMPIVGMTAHALVGDRDKCINSGMSAYLPKPLVEADLKAKIYQYLNKEKNAA